MSVMAHHALTWMSVLWARMPATLMPTVPILLVHTSVHVQWDTQEVDGHVLIWTNVNYTPDPAIKAVSTLSEVLSADALKGLLGMVPSVRITMNA